MKLADRVGRIQPSATLAIAAKAKAMKAAGLDVIGFGAGEPDFDTPAHIKEAAIRAIAEGFTKYTPVGGVEELKDAIIRRAKLDYGLDYSRAQVMVCCGAKHALYNAAVALFQEGDEVLIPGPFWVSYPDILALADAIPVILPTGEAEGFKVSARQLREAITPRTRALILNSPSNPTGTIYLREELEEIAQVVRETGIFVISDDIYDKLVYNGIKTSPLACLGQDLLGQTLLINGVSKTYAMTGWRIGYAMGPQDLISAMDKVQGQSTSNPTSIAQKAALAALNGPQECVAEMVREFDKRRRFMVSRLNRMEGVSCYEPQGAFYVFPRVDSYFGRRAGEKIINGAADISEYLLAEAKVAVVAGEPFGSDAHIRLSFALSMGEIEEGLDRMERALLELA
ncbi:MAG: pyridoxal phosphate-dependent aminotransferase [Thermodesulfobacteriota bacterium]